MRGSQFAKWAETDHRSAYEVLASSVARKIAKEKGIADPQKDRACTACHETAADVPAKRKAKSFDPGLGIQCESCHGPGGKHAAARMEGGEEEGDKPIQLMKGEIIYLPPEETCLGCHNETSPTYKKFSYKKYLKKVSHPDPRKKYPEDIIDRLVREGAAKPK
jgi:hypothetical protein